MMPDNLATVRFRLYAVHTISLNLETTTPPTMSAKLRIARPVTDLATTQRMYCGAFGWSQLYHFEGHDGFDGIMLGVPGGAYHFEFTVCHSHPVKPATTPEDLIVLYLPDKAEWEAACNRAEDNGFKRVSSFNPYWDVWGRTFQDPDGYRVVLSNQGWAL